ncbi:PQQ-dependent sugar dehydrogenase [soil metagenome]
MMKMALVVLVLVIGACATDDRTGPTHDTESPATTSPTGPATTPGTEPADPTAPTVGPDTTSSTSPPPLQGLAYEPVSDLAFPIALVSRPGDDSAFLAERAGIIRLFADREVGDVILDISHLTDTGGERGLLGLALHPEDGSRVFVHYTDRSGDTVVSEFHFDSSAIDPASEEVIFSVSQPAGNHNGGMIQFGPDGALYLGLGDGGGSGDRFGNGQNTDTMLGGIVRIDIDTAEAVLWQYGLRNPWRFWIDGDDIWIGDVGQNAYEEVDLASIAEQAVNYGWPIMEGLNCFQEADCDTDGLTLPLIEVSHSDDNTCSITGGVVYRGAAIGELDGRFLFSDYCGGYLRSVDASGDVIDHTDDVGVAGNVVSFGVDPDGEVYVMTVDRLLRLVPVR